MEGERAPLVERNGPEAHIHCYRVREEWRAWERVGNRRERIGYRIAICETCGKRRPRRRRVAAEWIEREAERAKALSLEIREVQRIGRELLRRAPESKAGWVAARGLLGGLGRRGLRASVVEERLDELMDAGCLTERWRVRGTRRDLLAVRIRDVNSLEEIVAPGVRRARERALKEAKTTVRELAHPVAQEIARLLEREDADRLNPDLLAALAAVARHAESGDILASRVFSARNLGDSKRLAHLRGRLEDIVGPLEAIGIREGAALTLLGGTGYVTVSGERIDLARFRPYLGLGRGTILSLDSIDFPSSGLLVVENLAPFEACCRGELDWVRDALVVWSGGYPGRGVRRLVEEAIYRSAPVRAWTDLDLDGVRIVRQLSMWCGGALEPCAMSSDVIQAAAARRTLDARAASRIRADLESQPEALLSESLRALLAAGSWIEQEAQLGGSSRRSSDSVG